MVNLKLDGIGKSENPRGKYKLLGRKEKNARLVFKRYRLYTAAIQNTEWYSLTLQWMPSDLQVLVVKKGFLRLSIDRVETKQSQIHGTRVARLGRGSKAKTARNSGL